MASVTVGQRQVLLRNAARSVVEWSADGLSWILLLDAEPLVAEVRSLPSMSSCDFVWRYGSMRMPGRAGSFVPIRPLHLRGGFVRVRSQSGGGWLTMWAGYIPTESVHIGGRAHGSMGDQTFTALGVEYLMSRGTLSSSLWLDGGVGVRVRGVGAFNERGAGAGVLGNRSAGVVGPANAVVFAHDSGVRWSAADILRYALAWFLPAECPRVFLGGELEPLETTYPEVSFSPRASVLDVVGALIERRRGLMARVVWFGGPVAELRVSTVSELTLRFGPVVLPANRSRIDVDLEGDPFVEEARVMPDDRVRVRTIVVRGAPLRSTFTMSVQNENMVKGWADNVEQQYRQAGATIPNYDTLPEGVQALLSDSVRQDASNPFIRPVFSKFRLDPAWNWELQARLVGDSRVAVDAGGGLSVELRERFLPQSVVLPRVLDDGTVDRFVSQPAPHRVRRFERSTTVLRGWDYALDPPAFVGSAADREAVEPLMVFAEGVELTAAGLLRRMYDVSRGGGELWPTATVTPADDELAVYVDALPIRHALGLGDFWPEGQDGGPAPNATPTQYLPRVDWRSLLITAAVDGPEHVEVRLVTGFFEGRELLIEIPEASLWWIVPGTVVGLRDDGLAVRVLQPAGLVTRDDRGWLRGVAVLALGFYARGRLPVRAVISGVGGVPGVGTMLGRVSQALGVWTGSWTPVSRVAMDFRNQRTVMESDFEDLQFADLVRPWMRGPGAGGFGLGGGGGLGEGSGGDRTRGLPARWANVAGIAGGASGGGDGSAVPVIVSRLGFHG